jgi:hypothetical protein
LVLQTLGQIVESAQAGCHFCSIVQPATQGRDEWNHKVKLNLSMVQPSAWSFPSADVELFVSLSSSDRPCRLGICRINCQDLLKDGPRLPVLTARNTEPELIAPLAKFWLRECENHELRSSSISLLNEIPTRLINISDLKLLRLYETRLSRDQKLQYATVSHTWGRGQLPKLLKRNRQIMINGFSFDILTPKLQESVRLARDMRCNSHGSTACVYIPPHPDSHAAHFR